MGSSGSGGLLFTVTARVASPVLPALLVATTLSVKAPLATPDVSHCMLYGAWVAEPIRLPLAKKSTLAMPSGAEAATPTAVLPTTVASCPGVVKFTVGAAMA